MTHLTISQKHFERLIIDDKYVEYFKSICDKKLHYNPNFVFDVMQKVNHISKTHHLKNSEAWSELYIAWYYQGQNNNQEAINYYESAYSIFKELNDRSAMLYIHAGLLRTYFEVGIFEQSFEWGLKGIDLAEEALDNKQMISLLIDVTGNYRLLGLYSEAQKGIERLELLINEVDSKTQCMIYQVSAEFYFDTCDYLKSRSYIDEIINLEKNQYHSAVLGDTLRLKAQLELLEGNLEQADIDLCEAKKIAMEYHSVIQIIYIEKTLAQIDFSKNNYTSGCKRLESATKLAIQGNHIILLENLYTQLYERYKEIKHFEKALCFHEHLLELKKNLFNQQIINKNNYLHTKKVEQEKEIFKGLYENLTIISEIGKKIARHIDLLSVLENIYQELIQLFHVDIIGISLLNTDENTLDYRCYYENGKKMENCKVLLTDETSLGVYCVNHKTSILINDLKQEYKYYIKSLSQLQGVTNYTTQSMIFCPIVFEGYILGILNIQSYRIGAYRQNDLYKLEILTSYIAIALENGISYEKSQYFASHDALTNLYNRNTGFEIANNIYIQAIKNKVFITAMMIDVDSFKSINDNYGHVAGDLILKNVSQRLQNHLNKKGIVMRYGGEEFLAILSNLSAEEVYSLAETIRLTICNMAIYISEDSFIQITTSIGFYTTMDTCCSLDEIINQADRALYRCKNTGRNRVIGNCNSNKI